MTDFQASSSSPFDLAPMPFQSAASSGGATVEERKATTPEAAKPLAAEARNRLLVLPELGEPAWKRRLFCALGLGISVAFFLVVLAYFAPGPGTPGIDENAYLVGGKNMAQRLSPGIHPSNAFSYVGPTWIR